MNHQKALTLGSSYDLERHFKADPVGLLASIDLDSVGFCRLYSQMLDSQSRVLAELVCAYIEQHPHLCAFRMINLAATTTATWRRIEGDEFRKDHPGQLDELFQAEAKREHSSQSAADAVRLFYRGLIKLYPDSREILAANFLSFDPLHPSTLSPISEQGDHEPMLQILNYLGHSSERVKDRLHAVLEAQMTKRSEKGNKADHVKVDYSILQWLMGSEYFDLYMLMRATRYVAPSQHRDMPSLRMVINALDSKSAIDVTRCLLGNLGWEINSEKYPRSIGELLVNFSMSNLSSAQGHFNCFKSILKKNLIELHEMGELLERDEFANAVLVDSGFSRKQLATVAAKGRRSPFDRACAGYWRSQCRQYEGSQIPADVFEDLIDIINTSLLPLDTASRAYQILTHSDDVLSAICSDQKTLDLLCQSAMKEALDTSNNRTKRLISSLCEHRDSSFANEVFDRILGAYHQSNRDKIVDLHDVTNKLTAEMIERMVAITPYEKWIETKGDIAPNLPNNAVYLQVLRIASRFPEVRYETLDKLYSNYSWYFLAELDSSMECFEHVDRLMDRFNEHPNRSDVCSLDNRIAFLESISFIGKINPFEFGNESFVQQAWGDFIETMGLSPSDIAKSITTDNSMHKARVAFEQKGQGDEFLRAAKPQHRDVMFGADLGL